MSVCTALYLIARSILKQKNVNFQFFCLTAKTSACFGISLNNDGPLAVKEQIFLLLFKKVNMHMCPQILFKLTVCNNDTGTSPKLWQTPSLQNKGLFS